MYRLSPTKLNFKLNKPVFAKGATSLFFKETETTLSCLTVEINKLLYWHDFEIIQIYDENPVGESLWQGYVYKNYHFKPVRKFLSVYRGENIPFLQRPPRTLYKSLQKLQYGLYGGFKNWWHKYYECDIPVLRKTAEWVLNMCLENELYADFGYHNFLMFKDEIFWYDPFVSQEVYEVIWIRRNPYY